MARWLPEKGKEGGEGEDGEEGSVEDCSESVGDFIGAFQWLTAAIPAAVERDPRRLHSGPASVALRKNVGGGLKGRVNVGGGLKYRISPPANVDALDK